MVSPRNGSAISDGKDGKDGLVAQMQPEQLLSSFGLPKLHDHVEITLENSLLSPELLDTSPSMQDGLDVETERDLRFLGCELIQLSSVLLRLPQVAAATGQILFQRFYYAKSFVRYNFEQTAMACLNLASKIEEAPRRFRDVINVFHHLKQLYRLKDGKSHQKKVTPMVLDHKYVMIKNEVIKAERRVLKELGFCVHVKHPHKLIYMYLKALDGLHHTELIQKSWNYMNDSLRTDVFLRYPPEVIACACMNLAARVLQVPFPSDPPWWKLFDAKDNDILEICQILLKLYDRKPPHWGAIEQKVNEVRSRMIEKHPSGISQSSENTPNPHATSDAVKFSPAAAHASPKVAVTKPSESEKAQNGDVVFATKKKQRSIKQRRSESSVSMSSSDGDNRKKLPKRYDMEAVLSRSQNDRVSDKNRVSSRHRSKRRSRSPFKHRKKRKSSRSSSNRRKMQQKKEREVRRALAKRSPSPLWDKKSTSSARRR